MYLKIVGLINTFFKPISQKLASNADFFTERSVVAVGRDLYVFHVIYSHYGATGGGVGESEWGI